MRNRTEFFGKNKIAFLVESAYNIFRAIRINKQLIAMLQLNSVLLEMRLRKNTDKPALTLQLFGRLTLPDQDRP